MKTELNLSILNGLIYTVLGYISYQNDLGMFTAISLTVAFAFASVAVILDK